MNVMTNTNEQPDYSAIKTKQKGIWSSGDYAKLGTTLQITGEQLAEGLDLRAGQRVLDVAAGNGNFTLAAARRGTHVTSTDYVEELLEKGQARCDANNLEATFRVADAENLPFADQSFDTVASSFGVMFTPNHIAAANEMIRVCRSGGKIGMANWTPQGFIGAALKTVSSYVTPPAGVKPPVLWGTEDHIHQLFSGKTRAIKISAKHFMFRYQSADHWIETFRSFYGPLHKAYEVLQTSQQIALSKDLKAIIEEFNSAEENGVVIPSEYLEIVIINQ